MDATVEILLHRISVLVSQRQELRIGPAEPSELERNRLQIADCQRKLNHALISRYSRCNGANGTEASTNHFSRAGVA
jgi:hypothetical protein